MKPLAMHMVFLALLVVAAGQAATSDQPPNYAAGLGPELEPLCAGIENSYDCAKAIEQFHLSKKIPRISRRGKALIIRTLRGRTVTLRDPDSDDDSEGIWYSYLKPLPEVGYHLVHAQLYQGNGYFLIGMHTGAQYPIQAPPVISTDRKRFVTVAASDEYDPSGIQIWRFSKHGPKLEWNHSAADLAPSSAKWLSPRKIQTVIADSAGNRIGKRLITRSSQGWELAPAEK